MRGAEASTFRVYAKLGENVKTEVEPDTVFQLPSDVVTFFNSALIHISSPARYSACVPRVRHQLLKPSPAPSALLRLLLFVLLL